MSRETKIVGISAPILSYRIFIALSLCLIESMYYALVKTGSEACSKGSYPTLSLFGEHELHTAMNLKAPYRTSPSSSLNNANALERNQFDIFRWQDANIGHIERMQLNLHSDQKQSAKYQWPAQWIYVVHRGHSSSGRIMLNRLVKPNRSIDVNFEGKPHRALCLPSNNEQGDFPHAKTSPCNLLNQQSNA